MNDLRNNKKFRIGVIIFLIIIVIILYFRNIDTQNINDTSSLGGEIQENYKPDTIEKKILLGAFAVLVSALGLESTNNDYDLSKLIDTKGDFKSSKVLRDKEGNIVTEEEIKSGKKQAKYTDEYNCSDFSTQKEAQIFFDNIGGVKNDINRLDGNKDGVPCESLK